MTLSMFFVSIDYLNGISTKVLAEQTKLFILFSKIVRRRLHRQQRRPRRRKRRGLGPCTTLRLPRTTSWPSRLEKLVSSSLKGVQSCPTSTDPIWFMRSPTITTPTLPQKFFGFLSVPSKFAWCWSTHSQKFSAWRDKVILPRQSEDCKFSFWTATLMDVHALGSSGQ